jgi:nucleotide-binding universal stress UspA family protein
VEPAIHTPKTKYLFRGVQFGERRMASVSHKLRNSFEGALAGGGDPATSPLYVFGPFLKLIVVAGVAQVTFGASVWIVVLTIAIVSAMYRLVMHWVTDGSGGSGLSEEEFGSWAVKIDAAITFIEYTLTFLVSMAAMVTFIADRIPLLNQKILWLQYRTIVAILLSWLIGWLVNRGPQMAVRIFGPATAGVLLLLWSMVIASLLRYGLQLPDLNLDAFRPGYLEYTIGGYVRILAVMTGIEVFANLVAAYEGTPAERSRKTFNSLLIIMGTTVVTMLIVGPSIFRLSDPTDPNVSVFTQTMDQLLPAPLPWLGTLVGVAVLMSASAASAQGLQNLALGLTRRRYLPPIIGKQNQFEVADKPVWIEVAIVSLCFLLFGTHEATYLAIYAAGVFILLSLVGWAVTKRLVRKMRERFTVVKASGIAGTILAASLTTLATVFIFRERFFQGAWIYFLLIPLLYVGFTYSRQQLGAPSPAMDYLGRFNAAQLAGFGFGQARRPVVLENGNLVERLEIAWQPEPIEQSRWRNERIEINKVAVLLDGSRHAAQAIPYAKLICRVIGAQLNLLSCVKNHTSQLQERFEQTCKERQGYLEMVAGDFRKENIPVKVHLLEGSLTDAVKSVVDVEGIDLVVTSTRGKSGDPHWLSGGVSSKLMKEILIPVLLVQGELNGALPEVRQILVSLDGSIRSERVLPYARVLASAFGAELVLLIVPEVPEAKDYRATMAAVREIRSQTVETMQNFLEAVARSLQTDGVDVRTMIKGSLPARTIVSVGEGENVDLIMMTSRGRSGLESWFTGSVAGRVVEQSSQPVFMVPVSSNEETQYPVNLS